MKNNYSPKEINIFNGVLALARAGEDITKITSQQIATAAGVGKATIYDYFASKEEIVHGALIYTMEQQARRFKQEMDATADFHMRMMIVYNGIIDSVQDTGSAFQLLLQTMGRQRLSPQLQEKVVDFMAILGDVLAKGHAQGIIGMDVTAQEHQSYVCTVIVSNVFATVSRAKNRLNPLDRQKIADNSYMMLTKALA